MCLSESGLGPVRESRELGAGDSGGGSAGEVGERGSVEMGGCALSP